MANWVLPTTRISLESTMLEAVNVILPIELASATVASDPDRVELRAILVATLEIWLL